MATLYLRPTSDSSLGHSCSSGSSGYTLVNEASADDDSTYIYQSVSNTSNSSVTSVFKVSGSVNSKIKISSLQLQVRAKTTKSESKDTAQLYYNLYFNGVEGSSSSSGITTSYANYGKTYNASDFGFGDTVFDSFDAANLIVQIDTSGEKNLSKNDGFQNRVTQVYLLVTYEPVIEKSIYIKQNGSWAQCSNVYKKVNGVWVEQSMDFLGTSDISSLYYKGG